MATLRTDGLVIRDLESQRLKTFLQGGEHYQVLRNGKAAKIFSNQTSFTDQYLLMPKSIFDNWTE